MNPLKKNKDRAQMAILFFLALIVGNIISAWSEYQEYNLLQRVIESDFVEESELTRNDIRQALIALVVLGVLVTGIVCFFLWFRRAYNNLHLLKIPYLKFTDGWAVGSFFVPFVNLYRPFQIMKEVWGETQTLVQSEEERYKFSPDYTLVGLWWICFLISGVADQISFRLGLKALTAEQLRTSTMADFISSLAALPGLILIVIIIKRISGFETQLYEKAENVSMKMSEDSGQAAGQN